MADARRARPLHVPGAAAAVAERTTEEHLTRSLGVRFATRPDGKAREILGVGARSWTCSPPAAGRSPRPASWSTRSRPKFGRAPNGLELDRLQRQATFATRRAKSHDGETAEAAADRWDAELRAEVAGGLAGVARQSSTSRARPPSRPMVAGRGDRDRARRRPVHEGGWTAADLTRAISDALPDHLGGLDAARSPSCSTASPPRR